MCLVYYVLWTNSAKTQEYHILPRFVSDYTSKAISVMYLLTDKHFQFFLYHGFKKLLSVLLRFLKWFSFFFICICLKKTKNTLYKILCIKFCVCMHMCMCEKWCLYKVICNVACIIIWYWTICIKRAWINKNKEFVSSSDKIKKGR